MEVKFIRSDSNAKFGVSVCEVCGVVISMEQTHRKWHKELKNFSKVSNK